MILQECPSAKYTDKGNADHSFKGWSYLDVYNHYFLPRQQQPLTLLEIGVSLYHQQLSGCSLWLWQEFFPNGKIYGLDIDPVCSDYERGGIEIVIASQTDTKALDELAAKAGGFDIIIDDGSHVNEYTIASLQHLWRHVKPYGLYCIEDLGCSYWKIETDGNARAWPGMKHNPKDNLDNDRGVIDKMLLDRIHELDRHLGDCLSIQLWCMMVFFLKAGCGQ